MALNTKGFGINFSPRAPAIPGNVGAVDVKEIYDGVKQGLAAFENARRAPASMVLADAEMKAKTLEAPMGTALAEESVIQAPLKTQILAAQAAGAVDMEEAKRQALLTKGRASSHGDIQLLNYIDGLRARVAEDPSDQRTRELLANAEAMATKKSAVSAADPQGATTAGLTKSAANNATTLAVGAARNETAERIAQSGNASRESIAAKKPLTGLPYILNRLEETRRALIDNPDDESIKSAYLDAELAFNKHSAASRADPSADRVARIDTSTADRAARMDTADADRDARIAMSNAQNKARVDAARQSQLGRQAIKAYDEGLKMNEKVHEELVALARLEEAANAFTGSALGSGVVVGSAPVVAVRSWFGDDTGKNLQAAIAQSMKSAVETMRGLGAMSQQEFAAAMNQLPKTNEPDTAINQKLEFLGRVRRWIAARNDMYLDELAAGKSQMQAGEAVRKALPMPAMEGAPSSSGESVTMQNVTVTPEERASAQAWLDANPDDPRAPAVRAKAGL